ncbi:MAG TPA: sulfurtransferase [Gammaproteobacteria bacterium]|nr:sulfurtransferase [Gammaproteobacteria bacterium]
MVERDEEGAAAESPVIEAERLAERLGDPDCIVVDCRFDLGAPDAGFAAYLEGHVPGARYAHLDRDLSRPPGPDEGRHPLPDPHAFAARLGDFGISPRSFVAAYDAGSGAIAARLWWMLRWIGHERAAVLNGGFERWKSLGLPIEHAVPAPKRTRYEITRRHDEWIVRTEEIEAMLEPGAVLVDARAAARFRGDKEPIDPVAGHVPGAVNLPFTETLAPDGRLRAPAELRRALGAALGDRRAADLVAMCGSGVTACQLLWAMKAAGLGDGRLYAGSWSEWIRDPARKVATGS